MNISKEFVEKLIYENSNTEFWINHDEFDKIYPGHIYSISDIHWTPVEVAIKAETMDKNLIMFFFLL